MIVDEEIEGFIKYLDDVSLQLACLLDIDGRGTCQSIRKGNQTQLRQRNGSHQGQRNAAKTGDQLNGLCKTTGHGDESSAIMKKIKSDNRRRGMGSTRAKSSTTSRTRAKRKGQVVGGKGACHNDIGPRVSDDATVSSGELAQQQPPMGKSSIPGSNHPTGHQHYNQQSLLDGSHAAELSSAHTFVGQLTLASLTDDMHLDRGSSISPLNSNSIQFGSPIHQHQYYASGRSSHLDSYQMPDDFVGQDTQIAQLTGGGHQDPLSQSAGQISTQHPQHHNHHHNNGLEGGHNDCYAHCQSHQGHQHQLEVLGQDHNHQHQHHHQTSNTGHLHYHQLDSHWTLANSGGASGGNQASNGTLQPESGSLDHTVGHSLSPATHLSLDHVQFGVPLSYQPHSYYSHQADQLDSFQTDDYGASGTSTTSALTSANSSARAQQMRQQQSMRFVDLESIGTTITNNTSSSNGSGADYHEPAHHHQHQHSQQQQLNLQQQQQHHSNHHYHGQSMHQVQQAHHSMSVYANSHQHQQEQQQQQNHHHQHQQQHSQAQQHQMMPLISGGIEPSTVILQDINLASATWGSSPEDLYSI